MRELPLNALRAFAMVYTHRGVRAAARELGMAHSSVSRHLGELDRWLGVPLLHGSAGRGPLIFTPQGEALGRATVAGLHEIEELRLEQSLLVQRQKQPDYPANTTRNGLE